MFGTTVGLTPDYDLWWSYIPHFIHSPFYVYAYAFGELLTLSLYEQYVQQRPGFVEHYLDILGAGASADPQTILKPLGVDLTRRLFWQDGIDVIARMVGELEVMARRKSR
jgi:oligoendopeptidase F